MSDKKKKIVMFEDDSMLSSMYSIKFSKSGFDIKVFEYPPENVEDVVLEQKPDLISMNIIMPHMDGFKATELLKKDPRTKDIRLSFLTNLGQVEDIQRGLELGADEYLLTSAQTPDEITKIYRSIINGNYKSVWTKEVLQQLVNKQSIEHKKWQKNQDKETGNKKYIKDWVDYGGWAFIAIVVISVLLVIFA